MPDSLARIIVEEALALERSRPDLKSLQVLDLVMRGRRGTSPDFGPLGGGPELSLVDPSGPFGALLSAAFDEQITFTGLRSVNASETGPNAFEEFWFERVMRAFRTRYSLHRPPA